MVNGPTILVDLSGAWLIAKVKQVCRYIHIYTINPFWRLYKQYIIDDTGGRENKVGNPSDRMWRMQDQRREQQSYITVKLIRINV